ncbi:dihydrofolate synthase/folylpolyglutamate synthase [Natranaerovirga hydrolytica]|uniref:tetrahydrofolate synthase n=1 Tax=Natranaerovirga hydrolytica TaxID=680378 RepID=A0A4R1MYE3_9FIRM|nr:folylpolyglutamate synthase/dihydrofolate synthase family protein [Natranaerovirga hydrolytica]TCK98236.1 dihydrofolate synthase/folylpolyglutamate synthase [Natranaerovirga hydrolytica]
MTYDEALDYIHSTLKFGSKLGLENIKKLLALMGNPQNHLKFIHIAGTNGKGSVGSMTGCILKESGYTVGMFTSPYIETFTERIVINDQQIEKKELATITATIKKAIEQMIQEGYNHPTEFEIVTALGLQYFYEKECDLVVLEVGMGGRLDATNVIDTPLASVITSISLDHTQYLGDTIDKIAYEKCGIIKENGLTISYPEQDERALKVIQDTAKIKKNPLIIGKNQYTIVEQTLEKTVFNYKAYKGLQIHLLGQHQILNAITAITIIEALNEYQGYNISQKDIFNGLKQAKWMARLEILQNNPYFIIDGAHNLSGIKALSQAIEDYIKDKRLIFLIGLLRDKAYEEVLETIGHQANVIITTTPDNPRALPAEELGEVAKKYCSHVIIEEDIDQSVNQALTLAQKDDVIVSFGSLYLIGEIRKIIQKKHSNE